MRLFQLDEENDSVSRKGRLGISFALQMIYSVMIHYKMFISLKNVGRDKDTGLMAGVIILTVVSFVFQPVVLVFSIKGRYMKYVNIALLIFVLSTMGQYGIGLYYSHDHVKNTTGQQGRSSCVNLESDMASYIIYLTTLPIMILTNILYPFPAQEGKWMTSVQNGFAMLDFLDMAELMFSDVGCYTEYSRGLTGVFFFALGVSAVLSATHRGLEQSNSYEDEETQAWFDCLMTVLNMLCNDGLFCFLRIYVMAKKGHVYFGLIFVIKEFYSLCLRFVLIVSYCRGKIEN